MSKETEHQGEHLRVLEFLREKQQETDDLSESSGFRVCSMPKRTAKSWQNSSETKDGTSKETCQQAVLPFIVKHILNLSAELKNIK